MSNQMNWRRARLTSKPCLDHRYEFTEFNRDRADRWLAAVERHRRKHITSPVPTESSSQ